jgi:hypothetical protein
MNASQILADTATINDQVPADAVKLVHGQEIRVPGSTAMHNIRVGTHLGYFGSFTTSNQSTEHAWTNRAAAVLDDAPMHVKHARMEQRHEEFMGAVMLNKGDKVWVDGKVMYVRILGVQYADPVMFSFVAPGA